MNLNIGNIKKILDFMNEFAIDEVVLKSDNYIQIEISKPFDYADDYFSVYIKDASVGYMSLEPRTISWGDFKDLDDFKNSDLYYKVNKYEIRNKILKI